MVILAIAPLTIVKVTPAVENGQSSLIGFLGVSYLTFRAVQTMMETRDGTLKNYNIMTFLQFMLFFPTISSGPIDRYRRFEADYRSVPDRDKYLGMLQKGIRYLFVGFLYKFILAYFGTILMPKLQLMAMHSWWLPGYLVAVDRLHVLLQCRLVL